MLGQDCKYLLMFDVCCFINCCDDSAINVVFPDGRRAKYLQACIKNNCWERQEAQRGNYFINVMGNCFNSLHLDSHITHGMMGKNRDAFLCIIMNKGNFF